MVFKFKRAQITLCKESAQRLPLSSFWGVGIILMSMFAILLGVSRVSAKPVETIKPRLYINYSAKRDPQALTTFNFCILDPNADADLNPGHSLGHTFLAYISTVEVRPGSPMEKIVQQHKVPRVGKNPDWDTELLDITDPQWMPMIVNGIAREARSKGFDGFFLDTLDSAERLSSESPEKARSYHQALVKLIKELRAKYPDAKIVINRGFELLDEIAADINGVLVESVFQTFDPATKRYRTMSRDDTAWLERRIRSVQMLQLPVFAVDYVQPDQKELARETAKKLSDLGCIPFVTTHDLNGTALAPLCEVPRRVLVLFGWDSGFADKPEAKAGETMTARHLQSPLEWLGYQTEYLDIGRQAIPDPLPSSFGGIIVDGLLAFSPEQERPTARWLERQKERGTPILFAGDIPFTQEEAKDRLASAFGFTGSMQLVHGATKTSISKLDGGMMNPDTAIAPRSLGFKDITAPASSEVFLSLRGEDRDGGVVRFDPIFLASWGGAWLEPYVAFRASKESQSAYADAFRFLGQWLHSEAAFPVPDTTTRDGRRLFFSHVSGEGFSSTAHFPGHPACAEVLRARVFQRFALPSTVSLFKAEPTDDARLQNITRSIFALPNVQAGSPSASAHSDALGGLVDSFEQNENPRRIKSVGLLYDMGIAGSPSSLVQLEKIYGWCFGQRLHPVTALEQSLIRRDAVQTKFFVIGPDHWLISNTGSLRTFRVSATAGVPDLARCRGVSGYKTEGGVTYIHTTGRLLTELVLVDPAAAAPDQLRLVESGADIIFHELSPQSAQFKVGGWSTVEVVFGGIPPLSMVTVRKNKEQGRLQADADGVLKLSLPPGSNVMLNVPRIPYAVSR